jgi:hypothetical protein
MARASLLFTEASAKLQRESFLNQPVLKSLKLQWLGGDSNLSGFVPTNTLLDDERHGIQEDATACGEINFGNPRRLT